MLGLLLPVAIASGINLSDGVATSTNPDTLELPANAVEGHATENGPARVSRFDQSALRRFATMEEAIDALPGFRLRRQGGLGGYSELSFRGADASNVEVYLDGLRLNQEGDPAPDLAKWPLLWFSGVTASDGFGAFGAGDPGSLARINGNRKMAPAPEPAALPVAAGEVVVRTVGLTKLYGTAPVFRDLSLTFESGRLSAVTGPSGSGKSTLLHLLAGLDLPTAGEVQVLDATISKLDATERALVRRAHIGLVTQGTDLVPFLTAQESVELALAMRGAPTAIAAQTLAAVGLEELAQQRVSRLSMGERQRVAVARALAARPRLLLADEPTARLDEANARAVGALFAELAATTGTAIVCATHDPVLIEHARAEVPLGTLATCVGSTEHDK